MQIRRVVTAGSGSQQRFLEERLESRHPPLIGNEIIRILSLDETPILPTEEPALASDSQFFPPLGGVRIAMWTLPPADAVVRPRATPENRAETEEVVPGMLTIHSDRDGMHATATVDVQYVISGKAELLLGDGVANTIEAGDVLVLNGQRHAWRNPTAETCVLLAFFYGAPVA